MACTQQLQNIFHKDKFFSQNVHNAFVMSNIQGGSRKLHTAFFAITLPTLNHFK